MHPTGQSLSPPTFDSPDRDESASAQLWAVYVSEAEKYDKALVEGWKSDMKDYSFLCAGLFSASLTAFLVESCKTLSPDQGTITIAILAQISRQLEGGPSVPSVDVSPLIAAGPTSASLACNALWFLSLGFSLSCALIATLVGQWSREFIQSTSMRPSPIMRARIFAYLYYGIQRFGMHTMVQFIPFLLHISLLLFFAGLIAFLQPINTGLTALAAVLLALISAAYGYLTVLPMFSSDSPYRTPLSNMVWAFLRRVYASLPSGTTPSRDEESIVASGNSMTASKGIPTMVEIMIHDAMAKSSERDKRDGRAMVWTVRSLTDDAELEPFVEALPGLVWGPNGRRQVYNDMINMLLETRDLQLVSRIESLLRGCDSGTLSPEPQMRRRISCLKAIWAIACFSVSNVSARKTFLVFDHALLASHLRSMTQTPAVTHHLTSAYALVRWSGFISLSSLFRDASHALESSIKTTPHEDPHVFLDMVQHRVEQLGYTQFSDALSFLRSLDTPTMIHRASAAFESFNETAYDILTEYLRNSADLEAIPYEFTATCAMIQPVSVPLNTAAQIKLKGAFIALIDTHQLTLMQYSRVHPIDIGVDTILHLLQMDPECLDAPFLRSLVIYTAHRHRTPEISARMFAQCDPRFMGALLTKALVDARGSLTDSALYAIWVACHSFATFDEATLGAISTAPQFFLSSCTIAILRAHILARPAVQFAGVGSDLPASSVVSEPREGSELWKTDWFAILVEFLECRDVFRVLGAWHTRAEIDTFNTLLRSRPMDHDCLSRPLQRRFADSFLKIVTGNFVQSHAELIGAMVGWMAWNGGSPVILIFNDPNARGTMHEAFTKCVQASSDETLLLS
ncbi:hypothetical protein B0H19DRAFT_1289423 [Mycena capillaripes]|nr:hypothetical protein B0H19DRAFT_1289423 [Mycena capillaripes]